MHIVSRFLLEAAPLHQPDCCVDDRFGSKSMDRSIYQAKNVTYADLTAAVG